MSRELTRFSNGGKIEFDDGGFDKWCVFVTSAKGERFAPTDLHYFSRLKILGEIYGSQKIYDDFVVIYNRTTKVVHKEIFELITVLSRSYGRDSLEMEMWFGVLYAGMIAEENKAKAILKKRIKRLGMYQLLRANFTPKEAATYSKGKNWRELDKTMTRFGF